MSRRVINVARKKQNKRKKAPEEWDFRLNDAGYITVSHKDFDFETRLLDTFAS